MGNKRSAFLKYREICTEITYDGGCRSGCTTCPAMEIGACKGCTKCLMESLCANKCDTCFTRCWKRTDLDAWIKDVKGLALDNAVCKKPYTGDLAPFMPQVSGQVWNVQHPVYVVPIKRIINPKNMQWIYKKNGIRKALNVPDGVKLILSFCVRDHWLEYIWTYQNTNWGNGKNFWNSLAEYGFDAALSVDFSCYLDLPRLDHTICLKRNVLSAERLSRAGIPVILDVLAHSDIDRERMYDWGTANNMQWYHMNYQTYKNVSYMNDIITQRCDRLFERLPSARLMITGVGDMHRTNMLIKRYGNRISFINSLVYMNTIYYRKYHHESNAWIKENRPLAELWQQNLRIYDHLRA